MRKSARAIVALALAGSLTLAACGDDDDEPAASGDVTTSTTEEETTTTEPEGETVEVTGVDYAFEGIDPEVAVGTEFTFTNEGEEAHELVLMKINDGETRPIQELLELPEEEAMQAVTMKGVAVAAPGEDGEVVDGELVADEAGNYVAICFIPVGTTEMPEGPPAEGEEPSGPPHFTRGMLTEFTVQ